MVKTKKPSSKDLPPQEAAVEALLQAEESPGEVVAEATAAEEAAELPEEKPKLAKSQSTKPNPKNQHGKKWREAAKKIDTTRTYPLEEAIELVKQTSTTTFDATVELHAKLASTTLRGNATLPHGTGKEKRVVVFAGAEAAELIEKVANGWTDFDAAVATPAVMPKLAKLAKLLGPKGLMPSPKAGTVSDHPEKVAEELKGGRIEYRADKGGALHQAIGKVSWDTAKLLENVHAILQAIPSSQTLTLWLTSSMGPSVRCERPSLKK